MRLIDRYPLRLVERGGVAVVDMGIVFSIERDAAPVIGGDGHMSGRHLLNRAKRSVLDPHAARIR